MVHILVEVTHSVKREKNNSEARKARSKKLLTKTKKRKEKQKSNIINTKELKF